MGVVRLDQSFKTQVTPDRMFKALVLDSHNICPKLMFSSIKSIDLIEGDGGVGSIRQMNLTEASPLKYVKFRMDELDEKNFKCKYTFIDVEGMMETLESITHDVKFEPYGFTGCICKMTSEYRTKENIEIKEEDIELGKDRAVGMYEVIEAYLLAHPHAYT